MSSATSSARSLSKSKVLAGLQCHRRVWLTCNEPERASPPDAATRAAFEAGTEVGRRAHHLFPGGILVAEPAWAHAAAVERTQHLLRDPQVPAIFEAAFEYAGVRIRSDVVERLPNGRFGLREVKSSTSVKDVHLDDLAAQCFVLEGCEVPLGSVELVHVETSYVRGPAGVDWRQFFARADCGRAVESRLREMSATVELLHAVAARSGEPEVDPGPHCTTPYDCEFRDWCTRAKPEDWISYLPGLRASRFEMLRVRGVERIDQIPDDASLTALQERVREVVRSGRPYVSPHLAEALRALGPPAGYLDFETMNPAIPLYTGSHPYELIPFQWSLHQAGADGTLAHREFLADGRVDPRREFAETLVTALAGDRAPVVVYSPFEHARLAELRERFPDLGEALSGIMDRLVDLLPVVRQHVYHSAFRGSFSLKRVAPALAPGFGWDDLDEIAEGEAAAAAFVRIASGRLEAAAESRLRASLLAYCARDTEALVVLHRALRDMAGSVAR